MDDPIVVRSMGVIASPENCYVVEYIIIKEKTCGLYVACFSRHDTSHTDILSIIIIVQS